MGGNTIIFVREVFSVTESACPEVDAEVPDLAVVVEGSGEILADESPELGREVVVDVVEDCIELLAVGEPHVGVGSLLSERVAEVDEVPPDVLAGVPDVLVVVPVAVACEGAV